MQFHICEFKHINRNMKKRYPTLFKYRMHLHNQHPSQSLPIPFSAETIVSFCKHFLLRFYLKKMKGIKTHVFHLVAQIQTERRGQTTKGTTEGKGKPKLEGKNEGKIRGQKRGQGQGQNHKLLFSRVLMFSCFDDCVLFFFLY